MKTGTLAAFLAVSFFSARVHAQSTITTLDGPAGVSGGFGHCVRSAGDVNLDGYEDVIVGSHSETTGGNTPVGRARVFSGKDGSILYTFQGESQSFQFGWAVDGAGDVNADGVPDLVVADYNDDNVTLGGGLVRIYSGLDGSTLHSFYAPQLDALGYSVAGAGDVNLDGFADVIAGAPQFFIPNSETGYAKVYSGIDYSVLHTFTGPGPQCRFGSAVDGVGDADGDGHADLLVGAYWTNAAFAECYSGKTGALLWHQANLWDGMGRAVSGAGDVNADGFPDSIVGGVPSLVQAPGHIAVFASPNGALLFAQTEGATVDEFGYSVAGAGDVNSDGFADVLVGAEGIGPPGYARVFSGKSGTSLYRVTAPAGSSLFGGSVDSAGDFNADGYRDFVVGAWSGSGKAIVYSGVCTGATPYGTSTPGCTGVERINVNEKPIVGDGAFGFTCTHAPPFAIGLGIVGDVPNAAGANTLALGVTFFVDLFASSQLIGVNFTSDAKGFGFAPAPIPNLPALHGASVYGQALWVWPGSVCALPPFGLSATNAVQVKFL